VKSKNNRFTIDCDTILVVDCDCKSDHDLLSEIWNRCEFDFSSMQLASIYCHEQTKLFSCASKSSKLHRFRWISISACYKTRFSTKNIRSLVYISHLYNLLYQNFDVNKYERDIHDIYKYEH